jgi:soluble lytic murein transglycosylase
MRFPLPHREAFLSEAAATDIPVNLLLAISRQESAFNATVTSPAGAKGLMQLMPGTAKETARKHNIRYRAPSELVDPEKNILIGSRYYKEMLNRFNNNRILATAAYNAGPARIDNWRKRSAGALPFDAWIETIPFVETRNYVQNVLAFSIIYAHHLGLNVPILSAEEKNTPL